MHSKDNYTAVLLDINGRLTPNERGVYELAHSTIYKIQLINHNPTVRCDATVYIDGKSIGIFRIGASSMITIERLATPDLGVIEIVFAQERWSSARRDEGTGSIITNLVVDKSVTINLRLVI